MGHQLTDKLNKSNSDKSQRKEINKQINKVESDVHIHNMYN